MWRVESLEEAEKIALGALLLGGGGGGSIEEGLKIASLALEVSPIIIVDVEELDVNSKVATASTVGSQVKGKNVLKPFNYIEALQLLIREVEGVEGVISSENGGLNTFSSWIQAAALGLPVVDAPCDGRAHPTALMGSLGLHRVENYTSIQAFSVGAIRGSNRLSGVVKGSIVDASKAIRSIASTYGAVAVARNPVKASYLAENAAVKALKLAYELGELIVKGGESLEIAARVCEKLSGRLIEECIVESVDLKVKGGFDVGVANLKCRGKVYELTFINEFMTLEVDGERVATFPDLITLINVEDGKPVLSGELKSGMKVHMLLVDRKKIPLGSGLKYREAYKPLEETLNKPITGYIRDILVG